MPGEDIQSWSVTAANNGNSDTSIVWLEGQTRASVNNSSRSEMAAHAKDRNLKNGSIVTGGTANAQTFTSGVSYTTIPTGLVVKLKIGSGLTNTDSTTLNMDGIGATVINTDDGQGLKGGELVGDCYTDFLYNGTNWIFLYSREFFQELIVSGEGLIVGQQKFDTAGAFTYTPTPGMQCCIIECIGGGGGGGGASGWPGRTHQGGGGGSGGYSRKWATATEIGVSQAGTIGAGGGGGSGVSNGTAGTATNLGTLCTANGGGPGTASWESGAPGGGAGGAIGTGDIKIPGTPGGSGLWSFTTDQIWSLPGDGGAGPLGGGSNTSISADGGSGSGYGAGGAGGNAHSAAVARSGGPGASGAVIIIEFSGRGSPGRDGGTGPSGPMGPPGPAGAGTGDVLVSGTPAAGQVAQWVDTSHIKGVALATLIPPVETFSTGDGKITLKTTADTGWVMMNDGNIGSAASGATTRANADTQPLFNLLYANVDDVGAPLLTSSGVATTRAAQGTAAAAFAANCRMSLTKQLGRGIAVAGAGTGLTNRLLGRADGSETHVQTIAELASHHHQTLNQSSGALGGDGAVGSTGADFSPATTNTGSSSPMDIMNPRSYWNVMIKL